MLKMPPAFDLIADSSVVAAHRPFFLPDFSDRWKMAFYPSFRISRLGKGITAKFASRYFDAVTISARLIPVDVTDLLYDDAALRQYGILGTFDYCVAMGEWIPWAGHDDAASLTFDYNSASIQCSVSDICICEAIESVSMCTTLKMGDVIMPCMLPVKFDASVGMPVTALINSQTCLDFRIK